MEKILKSFFVSSTLIFAFYVNSFCQKIDNRVKRLKEVEEQIDKRNRELEEYMTRVEELKTQLKSIKAQSQAENENKAEIENSIRKTQQNIGSLKEKYQALKDVYMRLIADMSNEGSKLYLESFSMSDYFQTDNIVKSIILRNLILGKSSIAKSVDKKTGQTDLEMKNLMARRDKMAAEKKRVLARLESKKRQIGLAQREIEINKRKLENLKAEIESLKESAARLSGLIKKLEKKSPYKTFVDSYIPIEKKSLPWPVNGRLISSFGKEYVEQLKTWIVRDGIRIMADMDSQVKSVMDGNVIYAGPFRNYGNIVIVSHANNVFTTYGLLSSLLVKTGDRIEAGSVLGLVGEDEQTLKDNRGSAVYFEIRKGSEAVDPLPYLR